MGTTWKNHDFPFHQALGTTLTQNSESDGQLPLFSLPEIQSSPVSRMLQLMEEIPHHFETIFGPEIECPFSPGLMGFFLMFEAMPQWTKDVSQSVNEAGRNPSINCRSNGTCIRWLIAAEMQCSWPSHPRHFQSDHPANSSVKMYKMDATNCPIGKMKAHEKGNSVRGFPFVVPASLYKVFP